MTPDEFTNQEILLDVGNGHQIYALDWGNSQAKHPIVLLHGGPGGGSSDRAKQFFDPTVQRVIFHDQRAAGKSLATDRFKHNTTDDLVADIETITNHFKLDSFVIAGGSWGSCLALTYAIKHPKRVSAVVAWGIFTGTSEEREWIFKGKFRASFPEVWEAYLANTPPEHQEDPTAYHLKTILGGTPVAAKRSAYIYQNVEYTLVRLDDRATLTDYELYDPSSIQIEAHYTSQNHFLPEGYILENASKLTMPVHLIQGRYDMICPPVGAVTLHEQLPNSTLAWTIAGHSSNDRANYDVIRATLQQFAGDA